MGKQVDYEDSFAFQGRPHHRQKALFASGRTRGHAWRVEQQLDRMAKMIPENESALQNTSCKEALSEIEILSRGIDVLSFEA